MISKKIPWSANDARWLSAKLVLLAEQSPQIFQELETQGLSPTIKIYKEFHRQLAKSDDAYGQVELYWIEYAKERLAALVGPVDILRGELPPRSTYRSAFLDQLRANATSAKLKNKNNIASPQIEPTIKRLVEMPIDAPEKQNLNTKLAQARNHAANKLQVSLPDNFQDMSDPQKYELLQARYRHWLEPNGFRLDSHKRQGTIFRKKTNSGRLDLLFIDTSKDGMVGLLDTTFAIVESNKAVLPSALPLSAVATIPSYCLLPGFEVANRFSKNSYLEMCLACDANSMLANSFASRIMDLLDTEEPSTL